MNHITRNMEAIISTEILKNSFEYEGYKKFLEEGLSSNPPYYKTDKLIEFTKLNLSRMKRIEKSIKLDEEISKKISSLHKNIILLVIAEGWCGDVAQNLPVIYLMANKNPKIELKIILRDENPDIMDNFLTNGTRSIPVIAIFDKDTLSLLGKWGPRPKPAQEIMVQWKKRKDYNHDKAVKDIQLWYLENAGSTIQEEFTELLDKINHS